MPTYMRAFVPGGTFFFTVVTHQRKPILTEPRVRRALRQSLKRTRDERPFRIDAIVLLPDHLHTLWTLPDDDADFSTRWRLIKYGVSRGVGANVDVQPSESRRSKGEQGVWQRRFWEHMVRDEAEFNALCDYIHFNPVKHGHAPCAHAWPYSSFHRFVRERRYTMEWRCSCRGMQFVEPVEDVSDEIVGE